MVKKNTKASKKQIIFIMLLAIIVLIIVMIGKLNSSINNKNETYLSIGKCTLKEAGITESGFKALLDTYKNEDVLYLRKVLNDYASGSTTNILPLVIESKEITGKKAGLSSFDKTYYRSQFNIFLTEQSVAGGRNISIIFRNKPDKIFVAWVYQLAGGNYELRGFWDAGFSKDEVKDIWQKYDYDCVAGEDRLWL